MRTRNALVFACYSAACRARTEEFSYDPKQPRAPKGSKNGGQWVSGGTPGAVEHATGHDLWVMFGFSYAATGAAAQMTGVEGYDDSEIGDWERDVARSMLHSIQGQKVRTTPAYSGHEGVGILKEGDEIEIPLMAVTPSRKLAEAYGGIKAGERRDLQDRLDKIDKQVNDIINSASKAGSPMSEESQRQFREAFLDIEGSRYRSIRYHHPNTLYTFASNKSTPIRSNERVVSGKYRVEKVERTPTNSVFYDSQSKKFVSGYSQTVTLSFVEDLPIREVTN